MEEYKFFAKNDRNLKLQITVFIFFFLSLIFIWALVYFNFPEIRIMFNLVIPIMIVMSLLGILFNILIAPKLYYISLKEDKLLVLKVTPLYIDYKDIKSIKISGNSIENIDTGNYAPWPVLMDIEDIENFKKSISEIYFRKINKKLNIYVN
jgi:hypothetical protein